MDGWYTKALPTLFGGGSGTTRSFNPVSCAPMLGPALQLALLPRTHVFLTKSLCPVPTHPPPLPPFTHLADTSRTHLASALGLLSKP